MIEMTYEQVSNENFSKAVHKFANSPVPMQTAYQCKKILDELNKVRKKIREEFLIAIHTVHGKKDAEGKLIEPYEIADIEKFETAQKVFAETKFTIERDKIKIYQLFDIKISTIELSLLSPLFEETPENVLPIQPTCA